MVNAQATITGQIKAIRPQSSGNPWQVDVLLQTVTKVNDLPVPAEAAAGSTITCVTDADMTKFQVNQNISASIKYIGDVPRPGIAIYLYNIAAK